MTLSHDHGSASVGTTDNSVAVIIPTFNHAKFIAEAIMSVLAQTRHADEIIVVDDGSTDDTTAVLAAFPSVRVIRQENRGLAAARNTGIRNCSTRYIVFLDADDRLLPNALEIGLNCISSHPGAAFIYGGCRYVSQDGRPLGSFNAVPIEGSSFLTFLRRNQVGGIMTVLFRLDCLIAVNGFDQMLAQGEDYDIYLRLTRKYPTASHSEIVGEYRRHGQNMSNDTVMQLKTSLLILDRHESCIPSDPSIRRIMREARAIRRDHYVGRMLREAAARWRSHHDIKAFIGDVIQAARWSPISASRFVLSHFARRWREGPTVGSIAEK